MASNRPRRPVSRRVPLADLVARRDRATVLSPRARRALAGQIAEHGCYAPLIVRPHPRRPGKYEILDGHHRAEVLRELGRKTARCEVWPVGQEHAAEAAATLNRLRGRQDARRVAAQARHLVRRHGEQSTAARLGITPRALRQQLAAGGPPRRGGREALDLHPVVFHLSRSDMAHLREALRTAEGGRLPRGAALMRAIGRSPGRPGE
ncbi:MAG TPA: ParB/RepB/Spo0J family partition protein [Phycisphaerae bacterium]|nr:ParB/RepB/Spo0J family partition protein [Phycisphaerae bacterium]